MWGSTRIKQAGAVLKVWRGSGGLRSQERATMVWLLGGEHRTGLPPEQFRGMMPGRVLRLQPPQKERIPEGMAQGWAGVLPTLNPKAPS